jgi:hypothetical protein
MIEKRSSEDIYMDVDNSIRNIAAHFDSNGRWLVLWAQYPTAANHSKQAKFTPEFKKKLLKLIDAKYRGGRVEGLEDVVFWFEYRGLVVGGEQPPKTMPGNPWLWERMRTRV